MGDLDETFRPLSKGFVKDYTDLLGYRTSFQLSKEIFETTKKFPKEEIYALTDRFRRAIRSVGANIAEAWGKRRYEKHFISKLTDADAERLETQHKCTVSHIMVTSLRSKWAGGDVAIICETVHQLRTSYACEYVSSNQVEKMNERLLEIGRLLNGMIERSSAFVIRDDRVREDPSIDEFF
jgi:four helix bundle protein